MAQPVAVVAAPTAPPPPVVAAVAPSPLAPVHALPPQAAPQPVYVPRPRLPSYDEEPFDINMLPGGLDMGRRKRAMAFIAFALLVIVLGGLVAMAIASQATHGL
jgi:hypothetical protein